MGTEELCAIAQEHRRNSSTSSGLYYELHLKDLMTGQVLEDFAWFVHDGGACLHKKRKNLRYFLDEAENRRNFASDLRFIHKFVS